MSKNNEEKVAKTPTERKKQLKRRSRLCFFGEIGCVVLPFPIMCLINMKEYFVKNDGYKVTIPFIMMIATVVIVLCSAAKKKLKLDLSSIFFGLITADIICWVLQELIKELSFILLSMIIGIACALVLEYMRKKKYIPEIEKIDKAINRAEEERLTEEVKEENRKVKIKIKK